jgi:hypothetical protein
MEHIKNDSLFTYVDSIDTQDFLSNYKLKKFPKLNHYAEMYLENLEKEKLNKEINSNTDSKDNTNLNLNIDIINDNASSIKGLSYDITNNDSIINNNLQLNKIKYAHNQNESSESNFKSVNYLAIEKLKENIQNKSKNKNNIISKVNTLSIIQDNKNNNVYQNQMKNKETRNKCYKKIIPLKTNKIDSRLFFNYKKSKPIQLEEKYKFSNNNKTQYNLYFHRSDNKFNNNMNKKTLLNNNNKIRLNKINKYYQISPLFQILTSNRKETDRNIKTKLINSFTENSQCESTASKNPGNKIYSITLNDYWKEKEIKKRIKLAKIKEEKTMKELGQLRDKPKINKNSKKIAEKLGSNSNSTVFERLSGSCNKILFNERKINLLTQTNKKPKTFKKFIQTTKSIKIEKNYGINPDFQTIKQTAKKDSNNKIKNIRYNTIKNENKIRKIKGIIKIDYNTEIRQKNKVQKMMQRNKNDIYKVETNRFNNKYINKNTNFDKSINKLNENENFNLLYNNNIFYNNNSTENIISQKNQINDKIKYLIKNKRLKLFLNKNKSSRNVKSEEISTYRKIDNKINNQKKKLNQKNKNINQLTNEDDLFLDNNITEFNLSSNEFKDDKNITNNNVIINNYNLKRKNNSRNKNIFKKNEQIKNLIVDMNSFDGRINKKTRNYINNFKNQNNDENCKIKRRTMDLLKMIKFSSNIRVNYKTK